MKESEEVLLNEPFHRIDGKGHPPSGELCVTSLILTRHLIFRVDNLIQFLGQFVDLKFCPER